MVESSVIAGSPLYQLLHVRVLSRVSGFVRQDRITSLSHPATVLLCLAYSLPRNVSINPTFH